MRYDITKVVLTLLVVFAHASRMYAGGVYTPIHSSFSLRVLTAIIYAFHMPAFLMLSGCIFGYQIDNGKYTDNCAFLKGKAIVLLIPYVVVGIFVVAPTMVALNLTEDSFVCYVYNGILLGKNNRHLWYVFALFWMFVLTIPLRKLLVKRSLVCGAVLIAGSFLLSCFNRFSGTMQMWETVHYFPFFICGIYLNRYWERIFARENCVWICVCAILSLAILFLRVFFFNRVLSVIFALAGCAALFCIVALLPIAIGEWKWLRWVFKNSYGIYLFHPMLIYILFSFTWHRDIAPWLLCGGIFLISTIASIIVTIIIREMRLGPVIGERVRLKNNGTKQIVSLHSDQERL